MVAFWQTSSSIVRKQVAYPIVLWKNCTLKATKREPFLFSEILFHSLTITRMMHQKIFNLRCHNQYNVNKLCWSQGVRTSAFASNQRSFYTDAVWFRHGYYLRKMGLNKKPAMASVLTQSNWHSYGQCYLPAFCWCCRSLLAPVPVQSDKTAVQSQCASHSYSQLASRVLLGMRCWLQAPTGKGKKRYRLLLSQVRENE